MRRFHLWVLMSAAAMVASGFAQGNKQITVTIQNSSCTPSNGSAQLSHDDSKKEYLDWNTSSGLGPFVIVFKNLNSPCYDSRSATNPKQRMVFVVPSDGTPSDACIAPQNKTTAGQSYQYAIYTFDGSGNLSLCQDPAVIITDGGVPGGKPKKSVKKK